MRAIPMVLAVLCTMAPTAVLAEEVTCASVKNARTECPMNTRGEVRLVRQLSKAPCTDGVTWGLSKHSVWVEKGCRAVFSNAQDSASMPAPASHGLPGFNATCPGMSVHGDDGGYVYINGTAASVKKFNDNYYEAKDARTGNTLSISKNPDETLTISYTAPGGDNGICQMQ